MPAHSIVGWMPPLCKALLVNPAGRSGKSLPCFPPCLAGCPALAWLGEGDCAVARRGPPLARLRAATSNSWSQPTTTLYSIIYECKPQQTPCSQTASAALAAASHRPALACCRRRRSWASPPSPGARSSPWYAAANRKRRRQRARPLLSFTGPRGALPCQPLVPLPAAHRLRVCLQGLMFFWCAHASTSCLARCAASRAMRTAPVHRRRAVLCCPRVFFAKLLSHCNAIVA